MKVEETGTVTFGRKTINYKVVRSSRRKNVTIAVAPADGVILYAPEKATTARLARIASGKAEWLVTKLASFDQVSVPPPAREFISGESFLYLGRNYRLRVIKTGKTNPCEIKAWRGQFEVHLERGVNENKRSGQVRQQLLKWYKDHAKERLPERAESYARKLGVAKPKIYIKNQQKRWGSCDSKGNLRFNWHIIMAPMSLVDYVVAHELCHLKYRNHSAAFWKAMRILMPDYEERRERLRREGSRYVL